MPATAVRRTGSWKTSGTVQNLLRKLSQKSANFVTPPTQPIRNTNGAGNNTPDEARTGQEVTSGDMKSMTPAPIALASSQSPRLGPLRCANSFQSESRGPVVSPIMGCGPVLPNKRSAEPGTAQGAPATGRDRTAQGQRPLRGAVQ